MVAAMEVPPEAASAYGLLDVKEDMGRLISARGLVEKPKPENAPSNIAVIGRYILTPSIFENLDSQVVGAGGEIQLTDAIAREAEHRDNVYGYRFEGQRFDCGSKAGFLQATVAFGLARPDLSEDFGKFLDRIVAMRQAAE